MSAAKIPNTKRRQTRTRRKVKVLNNLIAELGGNNESDHKSELGQEPVCSSGTSEFPGKSSHVVERTGNAEPSQYMYDSETEMAIKEIEEIFSEHVYTKKPRNSKPVPDTCTCTDESVEVLVREEIILMESEEKVKEERLKIIKLCLETNEQQNDCHGKIMPTQTPGKDSKAENQIEPKCEEERIEQMPKEKQCIRGGEEEIATVGPNLEIGPPTDQKAVLKEKPTNRQDTTAPVRVEKKKRGFMKAIKKQFSRLGQFIRQKVIKRKKNQSIYQ